MTLQQWEGGEKEFWADLIWVILSTPSAGEDWHKVNEQSYHCIDKAQDWEDEFRLVVNEFVSIEVAEIEAYQKILGQEVQNQDCKHYPNVLDTS